jgi:uncharacterized protein YndB with AHSA1/START domain
MSEANQSKSKIPSVKVLKSLHFEITIYSRPEKVFNTMIDPKHYMEWTVPFSPDSHFRGTWEKGAKLRFMGEDEEGNLGGMLTLVRENIPNKYLELEHIGIIEFGQEITSGPDVDEWKGAREKYTFTEQNGKTLLSIDLDSTTEHESYFSEVWPKALKRLKTICEKK